MQQSLENSVLQMQILNKLELPQLHILYSKILDQAASQFLYMEKIQILRVVDVVQHTQ
ncbi:hypothetical protein D3C75_1337120 [compost metagenome]